MKFKRRYLYILIIIIILRVIYKSIKLQKVESDFLNEQSYEHVKDRKDLPFTVLDWTAEFHNFKDQNVIKCNNGIVKWSENRNDLATADLVSFHLHEMSSQPTLSNNQLTLIYVMESEANSPSSNSWQNMDFAMWYNLDRSFPNPITYFYPQEYLHALLNTNIDKRNKGIVWLCSNCGASNKRTDIVKALKQHINIDFPGHCLQNMEPYRRGQMSQDLYKQYKYVIAIENSNCEDYITEKFTAM